MAQITEDYVSFETAKLLKEKGFNENCSRSYVKDKLAISQGFNNSYYITMYSDDSYRPISAPTLQMAMKWLREEHNIAINVCYLLGMWSYSIYRTDVSSSGFNSEDFDTYEEACEVAIKYCLENLI